MTTTFVSLISVDTGTLGWIWVTVVKVDNCAFIDVSAISTIAINIVETIFTGAVERTIIVSASGIVVTVMREINGGAFVNVFTNDTITFVTISTCAVETTGDVDAFGVISATVI